METELPIPLRIYGARTKVYQGLGIPSSSVSRWTRVPQKHVVRVAEILGCTPHELRPDLYPAQPEPVA